MTRFNPVQRMVQQNQHSISAGVLNEQFKKAAKAAALAREQQIGQLLETLSTLGLVRKTEEGMFVR